MESSVPRSTTPALPLYVYIMGFASFGPRIGTFPTFPGSRPSIRSSKLCDLAIIEEEDDYVYGYGIHTGTSKDSDDNRIVKLQGRRLVDDGPLET